MKGYAIRKNSFLALTKQKEIGTAFVDFIEKTYVGNFQRPLNEHRQEQIQRNAHRIDYINLQTLGMMELPVQSNSEHQQSQDENQEVDQNAGDEDKLCASAEDITLVKMARQVEKLEQQIEKMAKKVQSQSISEAA